MKKFVVLLLVLTLLMTPMLAEAAQTFAGPHGTVTGTFTGPWEGDTFTGDGGRQNITFRFDEVHTMELPTSVTHDLGFIIDPNGIFYMENEDIDELALHPEVNRLGELVDGVWQPLPTAGQVIFHQDSTIHFINEGNFDVGVELDFDLTDIGGLLMTGDPDNPNLGENEVTTNDLFIAATFATDFISVPPTPTTLPSGNVAIPITGDNYARFSLPAAEYKDEITSSGEGATRQTLVRRAFIPVPESGNGNILMLSGKANPSASFLHNGTAVAPTLEITVTTNRLTAGPFAGLNLEGTVTTGFGEDAVTGVAAGLLEGVDTPIALGDPVPPAPAIGWLNTEGNVIVDPATGNAVLARPTPSPTIVRGTWETLAFAGGSTQAGVTITNTSTLSDPTTIGYRIDGDNTFITINFPANAALGWRTFNVVVAGGPTFTFNINVTAS